MYDVVPFVLGLSIDNCALLLTLTGLEPKRLESVRR